MILLWGFPGDDPFDAVRQALERRGTPFVLLNQRRVREHRLELELGPTLRGAVTCGTERVALKDVQSIYTRVYDTRAMSEVADLAPEAVDRLHAMEARLWSWVDDAPARVVNRPSAMASNSSKPYQATLLMAQGFQVPESLVTTDPDAALAFWERHGTVIYKSISGVRSIVSKLRPEHRDRLEDVRWCPTHFQAYIPGRDYRVHVVGDRVFAHEIVSEATDYRYARSQGLSLELRSYQLPAEVEARCLSTARALGLLLTGLDLRRTPEGQWFCFEANPSPSFTFYEHHTGQPIADAVAELLASGHQ